MICEKIKIQKLSMDVWDLYVSAHSAIDSQGRLFISVIFYSFSTWLHKKKVAVGRTKHQCFNFPVLMTHQRKWWLILCSFEQLTWSVNDCKPREQPNPLWLEGRWFWDKYNPWLLLYLGNISVVTDVESHKSCRRISKLDLQMWLPNKGLPLI